MKSTLFLYLSLLASASACPVETSATTKGSSTSLSPSKTATGSRAWSAAPSSRATNKITSSNSSPATTSGTEFIIDGKKQYFTGTNAWWLGHLTSDSDVEQAISEIAATGLKTIRVWGFGNANTPSDQTVYYQLLDTTTHTITINNGTNGIPRLDSVIKYAEQYNLQLILPLLNNWDDLGGINTYCNYFGCDATTFYTTPAAQTAYQSYIHFIINRYKTSPAIFAWELCNEPRCHSCPPSTITNWATTTSKFIKSLDSTHLVTLGDEGWFCNTDSSSNPPIGDNSYAYSCAEGISFTANLAIPTLDYATFHLYPDSWSYNYTWGNTWISQHASLAKKYNKPVILEEYGVTNTVSNATAILQQWQATVLSGAIASDSWWQFATSFGDGNNPFDAYAIYYGTQEYQDVVVKHVAAMDAKAA